MIREQRRNAALAVSRVLGAWFGRFMGSPNEVRVLQLFGDSRGTARTPGLRWANPFCTAKRVSVRVRNFENGKLEVKMALAELEKQNVVSLDEERKEALVSNLLVVLTSERATMPVVNTGTLYQ